LGLLGYQVGDSLAEHPDNRKAVFLGDLVDRGPDSVGVLDLVMGSVWAGTALCVPGNHDQKLVRKLGGADVRLTHGIEATLEQLAGRPPEFSAAIRDFLESRVSHYVLDGGRLAVAHAGMKEEYQGRASSRVRDFALYGETTGENDEYGLPIRCDWAAEYRGKARVVYGHTPVAEPEWLNRTINIDTGCVFGGRLTALRYPELEIVSVPARRTYYEAPRPIQPRESGRTAQQEHDDMLDLADVTGRRVVHTTLGHNVTLREENTAAALEAISRFATNPKWLVYLPPTMSPCGTSHRPGCLEHPDQAFDYFWEQGVGEVLCEEKHMGSRAVVVLGRDEGAARQAFGVGDEGPGAIYTRTGRRFFDDSALEQALLARLIGALDASKTWDKLETNWICLDCELMPWSAKAIELLKRQYAAVGAAAQRSLTVATHAARLAKERGVAEAESVAGRLAARAEAAQLFVEAYRRYCRTTSGLDGYKLAPFHVLASEGRVHADKEHTWHMETAASICACDPELMLATPWRKVDLSDVNSRAAACEWWEELTASGGEGMVVKPLSFVAKGPKGLVQPAVKCRGREYLRIIYGPEYAFDENLSRLRSRGLGRKRSLALREFALGIEALERFVAREPLRRVHECVFGVLALESEPVDPRL
jgi:protein phosphatase